MSVPPSSMFLTYSSNGSVDHLNASVRPRELSFTPPIDLQLSAFDLMNRELRGDPSRVAVLLPPVDVPWQHRSGLSGGAKLRVTTTGMTKFHGSPRRVWILQLSMRAASGKLPRQQLHMLRNLVEGATSGIKADSGPWLWPVQDPSVNGSIRNAMIGESYSKTRRFWRIITELRDLPHLKTNEAASLLSAFYSEEIVYVLTLERLYMQWLWICAAMVIGCYLALDAKPHVTDGSWLSWRWILLMLVTLVWVQLASASFRDCQRSAHEISSKAEQEALLFLGRYRREDLLQDRTLAMMRDELRRQDSTCLGGAVKTLDGLAQVGRHTKQLAARSRWRWAYVELQKQRAKGRMFNPQYVPLARHKEKKRRILIVLSSILAAPIVLVSASVVLVSIAQLNLWLTYVWGRCAEPEVSGRAETLGVVCDATLERGLPGQLAEICSDVGFALVFDIGLSNAWTRFADIVAGLWNFRYDDEPKKLSLLIRVVLEAMSRIGILCFLAFKFVPSWVGENESCRTHVLFQLCEGAVGCNSKNDPSCCSSFFICIADSMSAEKRRAFFVRLLQGPFIAAPFIRTLVKVIIPWVAFHLERRADSLRSKVRSVFCCPCAIWLVRILSLIFALDGDNVGGLKYIKDGWPFSPVTDFEEGVATPKDSQEEAMSVSHADLLATAMEQVVKKVFIPADSIVDMQMSFLFVALFTPFKPIGLIGMLAAWILRSRMDVLKVLYVQRASWPAPCLVLQDHGAVLMPVVMPIAALFHSGVVTITYTPDIAERSMWDLCGIWFGCTVTSIIAVSIIARISRFGWKLTGTWFWRQRIIETE